jgi:ent-kaurenoic acid hydroxylase
MLGQLQAEQEAILKRRPPTQKGMTLKEYREMEYLSNVHKIDFPFSFI